MRRLRFISPVVGWRIRSIAIIFILVGLLSGGSVFGQPLNFEDGSGKTDRKSTDKSFDTFSDFDEFEQPGQKERFDPLAPYNRFMTQVNNKFYFWIMKPAATGYKTVTPEPVRLSVNRFFRNWGYPVRLVNNLLQLKGRAAAEETFRFFVNTTAGIGGLFDPAQKLPRLKPHPEDFGQTLGWYGVGGGFPIVLPFFGPSNLRDSIGLVPDLFLYPLDYVSNTYVAVGLTAYERLNYTSLHLGEYEELTKDALDLYIFLQNAYRQNREKKIRE